MGAALSAKTMCALVNRWYARTTEASLCSGRFLRFIHIYLANVEGLAPTFLMFFRKEHGGLVYDPDKHVIVGEDKMEH